MELVDRRSGGGTIELGGGGRKRCSGGRAVLALGDDGRDSRLR